MGDVRGPVRHRRPPRNDPIPPADAVEVPSPVPDDLQTVFTTLARRVKLPTTPEATPGSVLRAAGLPLLMATMVTGAQALPAVAAVPEPAAPQSAPDSWTVTSVGGSPEGTTGTDTTTRATATRATATPATTAPLSAGPAGEAHITYTVRKGDTLKRIAALSGRSQQAIVELNDLRPGQEVKPGQVLVLPPPLTQGRAPATGSASRRTTTAPTTTAGAPVQGAPGPVKKAPATTTPAPVTEAPPAPTLYTVQPGDTVIDIARRFRRSWTGIMKLNNLSPDELIRPDDVLKLPPAAVKAVPVKAVPVKAVPVKAVPVKKAPVKKAPAKKASTNNSPPTTRPYVVAKDDTLIDICAKHKVSLPVVLKLNHLQPNSLIRPGQKLLLPAPPVKAGSSENTFLGRTYPPAVVAAANANRKALAHHNLPTREQVKAMIVATAKERGLDPALALAVAYQESGFNQRVVSPANAVGVMQVIPSAGKWASGLIGTNLDLLDTQDNITAGVVLLAALSKAAENEPQAIAGYYQGLASVRDNGMFDDTRRYVANVQTLRSRFARTV